MKNFLPIWCLYDILVHVLHGGIAQPGERLNGIQEVSGSIPLISTIKKELLIHKKFFFCRYEYPDFGRKGAVKRVSACIGRENGEALARQR